MSLDDDLEEDLEVVTYENVIYEIPEDFYYDMLTPQKPMVLRHWAYRLSENNFIMVPYELLYQDESTVYFH